MRTCDVNQRGEEIIPEESESENDLCRENRFCQRDYNPHKNYKVIGAVDMSRFNVTVRNCHKVLLYKEGSERRKGSRKDKRHMGVVQSHVSDN